VWLLQELRGLAKDHPAEHALTERLSEGLYYCYVDAMIGNRWSEAETLFSELQAVAGSDEDNAEIATVFARALLYDNRVMCYRLHMRMALSTFRQIRRLAKRHYSKERKGKEIAETLNQARIQAIEWTLKGLVSNRVVRVLVVAFAIILSITYFMSKK